MSDITNRLRAIGDEEITVHVSKAEHVVCDYMTRVDALCNEAADEIDRLRAELDALRGQEPAFWYIPAEGEDDEDALLLPMRDGTSPAIGALPLYAAPVATHAPCVTCDELRDNLSDALGGRLHTDDEKARMIDGLLGMIGRISDALGISKEDQSVASGDEEILFAIEELKAATPAPVAQKVPKDVAKGWKCHCCGFDGTENQPYNRFCVQCRRSR